MTEYLGRRLRFNHLPSVILSIAHMPSGDLCVTGGPVSMTPVVSDNDSGLLESLLNLSFPEAMSHTSVQSDSIFYSAMDSPAIRHRFYGAPRFRSGGSL